MPKFKEIVSLASSISSYNQLQWMANKEITVVYQTKANHISSTSNHVLILPLYLLIKAKEKTNYVLNTERKRIAVVI